MTQIYWQCVLPFIRIGCIGILGKCPMKNQHCLNLAFSSIYCICRAGEKTCWESVCKNTTLSRPSLKKKKKTCVKDNFKSLVASIWKVHVYIKPILSSVLLLLLKNVTKYHLSHWDKKYTFLIKLKTCTAVSPFLHFWIFKSITCIFWVSYKNKSQYH